MKSIIIFKVLMEKLKKIRKECTRIGFKEVLKSFYGLVKWCKTNLKSSEKLSSK